MNELTVASLSHWRESLMCLSVDLRSASASSTRNVDIRPAISHFKFWPKRSGLDGKDPSIASSRQICDGPRRFNRRLQGIPRRCLPYTSPAHLRSTYLQSRPPGFRKVGASNHPCMSSMATTSHPSATQIPWSKWACFQRVSYSP